FYDYDGPGTYTCEIDWGDGTTNTVTGDTVSWTCYFPLHAYEAVGEYTIEFSVTDDEGASAPPATQIQQVVYLYAEENDLQLASNSLPTSISFYGLAPEGTDALEFNISADPVHGSLGVPGFVECVPDPYTQAVRCKGSVVYTPTITAPLYVGDDVFEFTVSDAEGHTSDPAQFNLWLDENDPPVADDGTAIVSTSQPTIIGVFATDMDAHDYSVDDLTFAIDAPPQHGTLQFYQDPDVNEWLYGGNWNIIGAQWVQLLTYTPNPGTTATTDTFTFHANDSHQDSNIATMTLTLHAPTAWHVNVNDDLVDEAGCDDTHCSLREAIADAQVGDTIDFINLTLPNTITLTWDGGGELLINKNISILGPGADLLTISAGFTDPDMNPEDGFRVFHIFNDYWLMEATISGLTIRDGRASSGGGISADQVTTLNLSDCVIGPNNIVSYAGGGIEVDDAEVNMENCTVTGNKGTGTLGGAGVFVEFGTLNATNSTITGNITNNYGGGLLAYNGSNVSLIHSTISGNIANHNWETEAWGGGAGIYNTDSTVTLQNSIVAGNTDLTEPSEHDKWPDARGVMTSLGGNLIGDDTGSTGWLPSDMVGTAAAPINPLLGTLDVYAPGTTPTFPLLEGSPAIDSAVCVGGVTTDQRGIRRPQGMACDRGAYEVENPLIYLFIPLILR
ncbi:MAG TPA: choice-of-anchor Q domain-containing protein, partial [Brevefilum fermentans]|nr:choice-of-anchor Q domain-containing protein [Brevefilum fermentans]